MDIFNGKHILITGGLGFIGSALARRLVDLGAHVTLVDSLIPEYGGNLFNIAGIENRVRVNISDVSDAHSMKYLVQGQDYLFNLAGQSSHMHFMQAPEIDLDINAAHVFHQYAICLPQRDALKTYLRRVEVGTIIHYPVPVHLQPAYRDRLSRVTSLRWTERISSQVLSLPIYPQMSDTQACRVYECIVRFHSDELAEA